MVTCEQCGKQLKNTQGLRGHYQYAHKMASPRSAERIDHQALATVEHVGQLGEKLRAEAKELEAAIRDVLMPAAQELRWDLHKVEHQRLERRLKDLEKLAIAQLRERVEQLERQLA